MPSGVYKHHSLPKSIETRKRMSMSAKKRKKRSPHSKETRDKISKALLGRIIFRGAYSNNYYSIHSWIRSHFGVAVKCEKCGLDRKNFEWSNKNHKYKRDRSDWQQLCKSCHKKYDIYILGIGFLKFPKNYLKKFDIILK
jgi:hypothetical protein